MTLRPLRFGLLASLLANLFLVGLLAGGAWQVRSRNPMIMAGSLRVAGSELPGDERRAFRAALQATRREQRAQVLDSKAAKEQASSLLRQPDLDQAAVLDALDRARAADMAVRSAIERRAVAFAATLPLASRTVLSEAMRRRVQQDRRATEPPRPE